MKHTLTYHQLFVVDQDLVTIQREHPGLALLENARIALFYQQATTHLEIIHKKMDEFKEKYIQTDGKGKFLVGPDGRWKFKLSVSDIATATILTGAQVGAAYEKEASGWLNSKSMNIIF
jgi:hypothetical protein